MTSSQPSTLPVGRIARIKPKRLNKSLFLAKDENLTRISTTQLTTGIKRMITLISNGNFSNFFANINALPGIVIPCITLSS